MLKQFNRFDAAASSAHNVRLSPPVSDGQPTLDVVVRRGTDQEMRRERGDRPWRSVVLEVGRDVADTEAEPGTDESERAVAERGAAIVGAAEEVQREGGAAEAL